MRKRYVLVAIWACILVGSLIGVFLILLYRPLFWDWRGQPLCHKGIDLGFHNWRDANKLDKNVFPNIDGSSEKSLAVIDKFAGDINVQQKYMYVAGLRRDDPGDLVLMYLPRPTRWTWHGGPPPSIFKDKAWILLPLDMKFYGADRKDAGPGEFSERVSVDEFRYRLKRTLDFLRDNERPNWEAVVDEHTRLLESLDRQQN